MILKSSPLRAGGVSLCLVATLAACTGTSSAGSAPPTASPSSSPSPTEAGQFAVKIDRPITRRLDVLKADPAAFQGSTTGITLSPQADPRVSFFGLSADDSLLAVKIPQEPKGSNYSKLTRRTLIGTWRSGKFRTVARTSPETRGVLSGRQRQVTALTQSGDHLLWVETASTDLSYGEWSLREADLSTGRVAEMAHSPALARPARLIDVIGGTYPVVIGGWVYWATAVPRTPKPNPQKAADWEFDIQRTSLSRPDSVVQTVVKNAVSPAALGSDLVYAAYRAAAPNVYEIHRRSVGTDQRDQVLVRGYRSGTSWITNLTASNNLVVWTAQSPSLAKEGFVPGESMSGQLFVLDVGTGAVTAIDTQGQAGAYGSIAFTRRGVAWGSGSGNGDAGEYLLDQKSGRIEKLGANEGLSQVMADPSSDHVFWTGDTRGSTKILWKSGVLANSKP